MIRLLILPLIILGAIPWAAETGSEGEAATPQGDRSVTYPASNKDTWTPGKGWKLVWADEFDGETLDLTSWTRQILPDPYNDEWQQYGDDRDNSYVEDGYLVLKAIHTDAVHGDQKYTSARLHTGGKREFKYGKIAARIQLPYGRGIWPAFWMLGADIDEIGGGTPWPRCGEIDILELYGFRDDAVVEANIHYDANGHQSMGAKSYRLEEGIFADAFHVFELEWNRQNIIWRVDGNEYCRTDITDKAMEEFHRKFYLLLNIAVGGTPAGRPDSTTPFPQVMYVDWVRVFCNV